MINKFGILNEGEYFSSGIFQNYLVFIPAKKYIRLFSGTTRIDSCKSNGTKYITKSDSNVVPNFVDHQVLPGINFNRYCLISNNITIPKKVTNISISYTLNQWPRDLNTDFTIGSCLFGSVKLTKNTDLDKYKYSSLGIGFDSLSEFSFTDGSIGKMSFFLGLI